MLFNCRNTLALLNRANVQKGISFLWTEEGNSFSRVSECFVGCGFSTGSIACWRGSYFQTRRVQVNFFLMQLIGKAVGVAIPLHSLCFFTCGCC